VEQFLESLVWQGFRWNYPRKPGKDFNGLTTTTPMVTMLVSPAVTLIALHRPSIGGRDTKTPGIQPTWLRHVELRKPLGG